MTFQQLMICLWAGAVYMIPLTKTSHLQMNSPPKYENFDFAY